MTTPPGTEPDAAARRPRRVGRALLWTAGGLVAVAAVLYGADVAAGAGEVPRGVRVAGVEIGGLDPDEAAERVRRHVDERATRPLTVEAGGATAQVVPAEAGLGIDARASVDAAGTSQLNPWTRWKSLFTTRDVPVVRDVDRPRLDAEVDRLAAELDRPVVEGAVVLEDRQVRATEPQKGLRLDTDGAARTLAEHWADPADGAPITLPAQVDDPQIDAEAVREAAGGFAAQAVAGPVAVRGAAPSGEAVTAVLPPERMGELITFEPDGSGGLEARFDGPAAADAFGAQLTDTVDEPRDATVRLGSSGPEVVPSTDGRRIDWDATLDDWRGLFDGERTTDAVYEDAPAEFSTADAEAMGIDEVIGEFTTGGFEYASGVNIRRVAQEVDGAVVRPGATFSLNGYTGPRGTAQGYVESGIILDGHADTAVGGGISQFATTLFNAAYFAGMEDAGHREHSYYISRYPAGREATVYEGAIDLRFTNPSSTGVLIEAYGDASSVTVRIWGTKTVDVESVNGGRWDYTDPQRMTLTGPDCSPSSGAPGFTTSDTRIIRDADSGAELSRSTETTVYDPSPIVTCT